MEYDLKKCSGPHSVQGYLEKQPTQTLDLWLNHYLKDDNWKGNEKIILGIFRVLEEREGGDGHTNKINM